MRDVHDVSVHLCDSLGDVAKCPRAARLEVVKEVVDYGVEVGLKQVEKSLNSSSFVYNMVNLWSLIRLQRSLAVIT